MVATPSVVVAVIFSASAAIVTFAPSVSAVGAFAASHPDIVNAHGKYAGRKSDLAGTKAHINSSVPKGAKDTSTYISKAQMASYKEMFGDELSDEEIRALHKRVSK